MSQSLQPTDEQVAAAQLRIELDKKLGRKTPEIVRKIATRRLPTEPDRQEQSPISDPASDEVVVTKPERIEEIPKLTRREYQVLQLVARGETNEHIARMLGITTSTVQVFVQRISVKLGVESRVQLTDRFRRVSGDPSR